MALHNRRILVLDDEAGIVQAYMDFLSPGSSEGASPKKRSSRSGSAPAASPGNADEFEILKASSGEEALGLLAKEYAEGRRIAAGFFDVKLGPGIDGIQTIQEVWKVDPHVHCTVVTAYQDRSVNDIDQLFGEKFKNQWDYLNKPFTQAEIVQKARQMIAAWNHLEELKETQAQLVRAERLAAIGQVARAIGHEFGNMLATIVGKADLALGQQDQAKVQEKIQHILMAAQHASIVVRNLQSFSKGENELKEFDPDQVIDDTLTLLNHELKKNSVKTDLQKSSCSSVYGAAVEIEQVLMNLIINAMHAMPNGGSVQIGCKDEGDHVLLWVKDTGTGIPRDVLPHIFEFAYTTKGDKGSGLGLSISKKIVENHKGSLSVKTETGKGTHFTIQLPKAAKS